MNEARVEKRHFRLGALFTIAGIFLALGFAGCQPQLGSTVESLGSPAISPSPTTSPPANTVEDAPEPTDAYQPVWGAFPPPGLDPATPIPEPLTGLEISDEVMVWALLGSDSEPPFTGRIQAIHLLFIHPRFSKASLVSIPGDLYVYIPGYTMQRINTAYALGGIETLRETLAYNFGVTPSRFILAHPGDFQWLVDDLDTVEVTVFYPMPQACGGIRAGRVAMDGALALCYASYREDMDEVSRMERQQQLLRVIFHKLTNEGYLVKLPLLYASYEGWIKTDLSLEELVDTVPLALRLADPDRIGYYMLGWDAISLWEVPDQSQAQVFLPDRGQVRTIFQQAIDDVMEPQPLTNQVSTLEAQLTALYEATLTPAPTATPTPEPTLTGATVTLTPTATPPGYP